MVDINSVVQVNITAQTKTVSRAGFGTPGILSSEAQTVQAATTAVYSSVDELIAAGFSSSGRLVAIATRLFGQSPSPQQIVVGKYTPAIQTKQIIPVAPLKPSHDYTLTINGVAFTFTTDADPTVAEITAGLEAAIDGGTEDVNALDNTTNLDVSGADGPGGTNTAGVFFTLEYDRALFTVQDTTPASDVAAALNTMRTAIDGNDDWYALHLDTYSGAAIRAVSATADIQNEDKLFFAATGDADVPAGTANSVADDLANNTGGANGSKVVLMYHPFAEVAHPAAAWMGQILPQDPGSVTWKFKTLTGVSSYKLTAAESAAVIANNCNYYVELLGNDITGEGVTSEGEFIDVERFVAFLTARMQENVFLPMLNLPKIPMTDAGLAVIDSRIRETLLLGIRVGGLAPLPAFTVTVPAVADISQVDRANRFASGFEFSATLAGAVHKTSIAGVLTV